MADVNSDVRTGDLARKLLDTVDMIDLPTRRGDYKEQASVSTLVGHGKKSKDKPKGKLSIDGIFVSRMAIWKCKKTLPLIIVRFSPES
jgi:hypothetical protein